MKNLFAALIPVLLAATFAYAGKPAHAQEAQLLGSFGDWEAFTRGGKDDRFCYIVSKPKEASMRSRRGDIFLLIWHRPAKKEFSVVQVNAGYTYKEDSEVKIKIDAMPGCCSPAMVTLGHTPPPMMLASSRRCARARA